VSWLFWFARVRAVAEGFAPGRLRYRQSMAVLAWFIPVGNLYLPKQIANDVWHASSPAGTMAPAGRLNLWWCCWLATLASWPLFWTTVIWVGFHGGITHLAEPVWLGLVLRIPVVPVAVVTARYIHGLTKLQRARLDT
jgi:hypothetical protein